MRNLYKNLLPIFVVALVSTAVIPSVRAQDNIQVNENEIVIVVHGIVCSFCSQGVTKKLSKLSFIDSSKYTKGVRVDIENQRVTIAVKVDVKVDYGQIFASIKSGGYEPVSAYTDDGEAITPEGN